MDSWLEDKYEGINRVIVHFYVMFITDKLAQVQTLLTQAFQFDSLKPGRALILNNLLPDSV